jgi:hypothetical protein
MDYSSQRQRTKTPTESVGTSKLPNIISMLTIPLAPELLSDIGKAPGRGFQRKWDVVLGLVSGDALLLSGLSPIPV